VVGLRTEHTFTVIGVIQEKNLVSEYLAVRWQMNAFQF
jgi:hypothetical protein